MQNYALQEGSRNRKKSERFSFLQVRPAYDAHVITGRSPFGRKSLCWGNRKKSERFFMEIVKVPSLAFANDY